MSEMVERVAIAIESARNEFFERGGKGCGSISEFQARAAIEAMREPTEAMSARADAIDSRGVDDEPINPEADYAYRAMIDEALR
jgi:hypothetical protein